MSFIEIEAELIVACAEFEYRIEQLHNLINDQGSAT